jgi:prevent-host-death family protein
MAIKEVGVAEVSVHEARNQLSRLIKRAQAGEETVITSHGRPVARLVGVTPARGRQVVEWLAANPLPESSRRTPEEIDAAVAAERESWE